MNSNPILTFHETVRIRAQVTALRISAPVNTEWNMNKY
jgi:hypothetical protein